MLSRIQSILLYAVLLLFCLGVWKVFLLLDQFMANTRIELEKAQQEITRLEDENNRLELANILLKKDHRLARISQIVSKTAPESGQTQTSFAFCELDGLGQPQGVPQTYTIQGDVVYIDTLLVKFEDSYVEQGDEFRGASLCLFRRLFGENQTPSDGFLIDSPIGTPRSYQLDKPLTPEMIAFQQNIWGSFWQLATNPELAKQKGVRAAQGSAPSQKLVPGLNYQLELRNTGELTFRIETPASASTPTTVNLPPQDEK